MQQFDQAPVPADVPDRVTANETAISNLSTEKNLGSIASLSALESAISTLIGNMNNGDFRTVTMNNSVAFGLFTWTGAWHGTIQKTTSGRGVVELNHNAAVPSKSIVGQIKDANTFYWYDKLNAGSMPLLGTFTTLNDLYTFLDTLAAGLATGDVRMLRVTCGASGLSPYVNGINYGGYMYRTGSATYLHVMFYSNSTSDVVSCYRNANGWGSELLALNRKVSTIVDVDSSRIVSDANNAKEGGTWYFTYSTANSPGTSSGGYYTCFVIKRNANNVTQTAIDINQGNIFTRSFHDGTTWTDWKEYALKSDVAKYDPSSDTALSDCNSATETGRYKTVNNTSNTPVTGHFVLDVIRYNNAEISQVARLSYSTRVFVRGTGDNGSTWTTWQELALNSKLPNVPQIGKVLRYDAISKSETSSISIPDLSKYSVFAATINSEYSNGPALGVRSSSGVIRFMGTSITGTGWVSTYAIMNVSGDSFTNWNASSVWGTQAIGIINLIGIC